MQYEWDLEKDRRNQQRHLLSLSDAIPALEDPYRLEQIDDRFDYGEERLITIGASPRGIIVVVTTARGEDICRIISCRRATREEHDRYFTA